MAKRTAATLKIRDEVAALKRERTFGAAVDLFYDKGAERLGMTKPFIYANFGSKGELLAEICQRGVEAAASALDATLARRKGPRESLESFGRDYVTAVLGNQKLIAVYVREEKNLAPADALRIGAMRREFFNRIAKLLEKGVAAGEFRIDDAQLAALAIGGAVTWSTFWYRPEGRLSLADIAETMTGLILTLAGASGRGARRRA
jgi:AcrR family transcriptional regulator